MPYRSRTALRHPPRAGAGARGLLPSRAHADERSARPRFSRNVLRAEKVAERAFQPADRIKAPASLIADLARWRSKAARIFSVSRDAARAPSMAPMHWRIRGSSAMRLRRSSADSPFSKGQNSGSKNLPCEGWLHISDDAHWTLNFILLSRVGSRRKLILIKIATPARSTGRDRRPEGGEIAFRQMAKHEFHRDAIDAGHMRIDHLRQDDGHQQPELGRLRH